MALRTVFAGSENYLFFPCSDFPHFLPSLHPSFLLLQLSITQRAALVPHVQVKNSHAFNCLKWRRAWSWGSYGCLSTLEHTRSWITGSCGRGLIYSSELFPRKSWMVRILCRVLLLAAVVGPRAHFLATWRPHSEATCNPHHIGAIVTQASLLPDQESLSLCAQTPLNGFSHYVRFTRLASLSLIWNQFFLWFDYGSDILSCPFSRARGLTGMYLLGAWVLKSSLEYCLSQQLLCFCALVWERMIYREQIQPCLILQTLRPGRLHPFFYRVSGLHAPCVYYAAMWGGFFPLLEAENPWPYWFISFPPSPQEGGIFNCLVNLNIALVCLQCT